MKRGDIVIVTNTATSESGKRPAIVVSNDEINEHSVAVDVVLLTTQPHVSSYCVQIESSLKPSIAKCEYVYSVEKQYLEITPSHLTDSEMQAVDKALARALGLEVESKTDCGEGKTPVDNGELAKATRQRNVYKILYENLVAILTE